MSDRARKLLDELLGPSRNYTKDEINDLNVPENCIFNTIGICPYYALENTKGFIKRCVKKDHKTIPLEFIDKKTLRDQEKQLLIILKKIVCELEIRKTILLKENESEFITEIESIKIETLAKNNKLEESQKLASELYQSKQKENQKLIICYICGIKITNSSTSKEYKTHLSGKLHLSYIKIREIFSRLLFKYEEKTKIFLEAAEISKIKAKYNNTDKSKLSDEKRML